MSGWRSMVVVTVLLTGAAPAGAWGPTVHQTVTLRAIDTLPKQLKPFYKDHRLEIPSLAPDATPGEEGLERRFAVDRLMPFPFTDVPRREAEMKERFGDSSATVGRLPWLIHQSYERLVEAFKAKDKAKIL